MTEPSVDVQVTLTACPVCGGPLAEERVDLAYVTELAALPHPKVTQYRVSVCRCTVCGTQGRGQHPEVAPDQYGASAHRLGARAMAAAPALHDGIGLSVCKVPVVLGALTGVRLTQGAITQDALRRAAGVVGIAYERLRASVPEAPVVHTDDTGWRVGGETAYLMPFETEAATVYQIRPRHRHDEVQEVIPPEYEGVMVTDRGRSDDAPAFDGIHQQTCLAHILRSLSDVVATKTGRARHVGEQLKALLQEALALWHDHRAGQVTAFRAEAEALQGSSPISCATAACKIRTINGCSMSSAGTMIGVTCGASWETPGSSRRIIGRRCDALTRNRALRLGDWSPGEQEATLDSLRIRVGYRCNSDRPW